MTELDDLLERGERLRSDPGYTITLAEEWLRIRDRTGQSVALKANAAQQQFEQQCGRQNIILKARQMGMTTWIAGRFFLRTITTRGTLTLLVAHDRESSEAIFQLVQRMWTHLPEKLRKGTLRRSRANVGQMVFPELDSEFRIATAADENAGRGLSVQNLHCSELSRWPGDAAATLAGLRAALAPAGQLVLESTPNGTGGAFYNEWQAGVESCNGLDGVVRHFLPWWMEPAYIGPAVEDSTLTEAECELMQKHHLNLPQIGFRRQLEAGYGVLRSQEFAEDAETCFRATGACCFDVEAIERRMAVLEPELETRRGGSLRIWLRPARAREYVVGVDTAGGGPDGDFAAAQVVELSTGLQCAELQQRLRPADLAQVAVELAREYNGAAIAVERNNHGSAVLAYIEMDGSYANLWSPRGGEPGWLTTAACKPEMVARLGSLLSRTPERFLSRRLLAECRTYVSKRDGKSGAAGGSHDDLVMAMAVAHAVRAEMLNGGSVRRDSS